ncbi:MAG: hypothetical protein EOO59_05605, partial [Hymenobacter sp.]
MSLRHKNDITPITPITLIALITPMNISRKKPSYPLTPALRQYLRDYDREAPLPVSYADLRRFTGSFALLDRAGKDTLWETVYY